MTNATAHNGGKAICNPNFIQFGGEFPFLNLLKSAQYWTTISPQLIVDPSTIDSDGYPTGTGALVNGGVYSNVFVPTVAQSGRSGWYKATWTGNGTIFASAASITTQGGTSLSTSGYTFSIDPAATTINIGIAVNGTPKITNLKLFAIEDETALNAGDIFGVKFKQRLIEGNFAAIRFLNWQGGDGNTTNLGLWAHNKPESYVYYHGPEYRPSLYSGTTTLTNGTFYSIPAPSTFTGLNQGTLVIAMIGTSSPTRDTVGVTFTNGSANIVYQTINHLLAVGSRVTLSTTGTLPTGFDTTTVYYVVTVVNATTIQISATSGGTAIVAGSAGSGTQNCLPRITLNVGGTGDIPMLNYVANPLSLGSNSYPTAGYYAAFLYDSVFGAWIKRGGDLAHNSNGIRNGPPPSIMLRLCAEIGAHPYFITPSWTVDPVTDYMPSLAAMCRDTAPSWMVPRFETPNELWNTQFQQTTVSSSKATLYGWVAHGYNDHMGKIASTLGQAVANVYGIAKANVKTQTKYHVICGLWTTDSASNAQYRVESTAYLSQTPQAGYAADAAKDWITHICWAQYFTPPAYYDGREATLVAQWNNGADPTACVPYVNSLTEPAANYNRLQLQGYNTGWKAFGIAHGVTKGCGYEGWYSPNYVSNGTTTAEKFRAATKAVPALGTIGSSILSDFVGITDGTFTAEFPAIFNLGGATPSDNAWSVLENVYQTPDPPSWTAIKAFNAVSGGTTRQFSIRTA